MKPLYFNYVLSALTLFCLPAPSHAQEASLSGVYIGAKAGASIEAFSDRHVMQDAYSLYQEGVGSYSSSAQSWAFPDKTDTAAGGGVQLGYNFAQTGYPIRIELDYTARGEAEVSSTRNMTWSWTLNGTYYGGIPGVMTQADKVSLDTFLANFWYDIPTGTAFTPYIGGGIGWGFVSYTNTRAMDSRGDSDSFTDKKDGTNFAWSLGAGVSYALTPHVAIDIGYRYIDAGDMKVSASGGEPLRAAASIATHDLMAGLRYSFGSAPIAPLK